MSTLPSIADHAFYTSTSIQGDYFYESNGRLFLVIYFEDSILAANNIISYYIIEMLSKSANVNYQRTHVTTLESSIQGCLNSQTFEITDLYK